MVSGRAIDVQRRLGMERVTNVKTRKTRRVAKCTLRGIGHRRNIVQRLDRRHRIVVTTSNTNRVGDLKFERARRLGELPTFYRFVRVFFGTTGVFDNRLALTIVLTMRHASRKVTRLRVCVEVGLFNYHGRRGRRHTRVGARTCKVISFRRVGDTINDGQALRIAFLAIVRSRGSKEDVFVTRFLDWERRYTTFLCFSGLSVKRLRLGRFVHRQLTLRHWP